MKKIFLSLFIVLIIYLCGLTYIKKKHPFTSQAPCFHVYNILYWIKPPKIIIKGIPHSDKYINNTNITTYDINTISEDLKDTVTTFLKENYLNMDNLKYIPTKESIFAQFNYLKDKSYLSIYHIDNEIVSVISTKPLDIEIRNNKVKCYYGTFLCTNKKYRGKGISEQMLQSHTYNCVVNCQDRLVGLVSRQANNLNTLVPISTIKCKNYLISKNKTTILNKTIHILKITEKNIDTFINFIDKIKDTFNFFAIINTSNLIHLLNTKNYVIYLLLDSDDNIDGCYILKDEKIFITDNKVYTLLASIKNNNSLDAFLTGFNHILDLMKIKIISICEMGDNYLITNDDSFNSSSKLLVSIDNSFYFHNYADRPIKSEKFMFLV